MDGQRGESKNPRQGNKRVGLGTGIISIGVLDVLDSYRIVNITIPDNGEERESGKIGQSRGR